MMLEMDNNVEKKKFTAMVIDDDEDTVNLFAEFLDISDVKVLAKAFDGKTAVELYKKFSPDIVFSDVMMPDYDGFYVIENIRKINPDAILVMVTADVRQDTVERLERLRADAVIYKPFEMKKILVTVNDLLLNNASLISTSH